VEASSCEGCAELYPASGTSATGLLAGQVIWVGKRTARIGSEHRDTHPGCFAQRVQKSMKRNELGLCAAQKSA
jgi:hypothetical protein